MVDAIFMALAGAIVSATGGGMIGFLLGRRARARTALENERQAQRIQELERQLDEDRTRVESASVRESVLEAVKPLMVHEQRARNLRSLPRLARGRRELPALLDMMAERGGFARVLLSDEVGLPIAASSRAHDADALAGISSLIIAFADRVQQASGPIPTAVLVRDAASQLALHRIFSLGGERYIVTAISTGGEVSVDALDAALAAIEDSLDPASISA